MFDQFRRVLHEADVLFVDGPKDGRFEAHITRLLLQELRPGTILVYDDIRVMSMVQFWRELPLPKMDVTSLGHWSGTGLAVASSPTART